MRKISFSTNDAIAGVLSGLVIIIISTAFAALVFKGPLTSFFSIGISCTIIGSCLVNFFTASLSSFRFGIARAEPAVGAILAIIFADVASYHLTNSLPTLLAISIICCLLVGVIMFFLGFFRLGQTIRFLPYPVLGGIITGTAWIMASSSFSLMFNATINIDHLLQTQLMMQYLTGIGYAVILLILLKGNSRPWLLPISLLIVSIIINVILSINHVSHTAAIQMGWMFPSFKATFVLDTVDFSLFKHIDWYIIFRQLSYIASLIGVIIILSLLNVSGLEAATKNKADLERELKITGVANILNGLLIGVPSNLSFSGTILNKNAGAQNRISGIIASLFSVIVLFLYPDLISYLPKPVIGGLLLYIAAHILIEWLYDGLKKLPIIDYLIVISILISVAIWGFLTGMVVGILITCTGFIIRYARINAIKYSITGENYHSTVVRPFYQQNWLIENGKKVQIFKLQGYLFFGSAKLLIDNVTKLVEQEGSALKFLIFDFQQVNGVDSSSNFSFIRLQQLIDTTSLTIIFTGCSEILLNQFKKQQVIGEASRVIIIPDLDLGLEWCENQLIEMMPKELIPQSLPLLSTLNQLIPDENQRKIFLNYLNKIEVPANTNLIKQGDIIGCLYFIESGEVAVYLESKNMMLRVSKSGPGTIVGEISFYLHTSRTATVRTETPCIIYELTSKSIVDLEKSHPDAALAFHKGIISVLATRVIQTNYELTLLS